MQTAGRLVFSGNRPPRQYTEAATFIPRPEKPADTSGAKDWSVVRNVRQHSRCVRLRARFAWRGARGVHQKEDLVKSLFVSAGAVVACALLVPLAQPSAARAQDDLRKAWLNSFSE